MTAAGIFAEKLSPVRLIVIRLSPLVFDRAATKIQQSRWRPGDFMAVRTDPGKLGSQGLIQLEYFFGLKQFPGERWKVWVSGVLYSLVHLIRTVSKRPRVVLMVRNSLLQPIRSLSSSGRTLLTVYTRLMLCVRRLIRRDARLKTANAFERWTGT